MSIAGDPQNIPIEEKRDWALEQYRLYGARLREDDAVQRLLADLRARVAASNEAMIAAGVAEDCRACEEQEGGSCCGRGLEDHCDGVLLLINLLLCAVIEKDRRDEQSCFFLGKRGCRLQARDHICVNYLCAKVHDRVSPHALTKVREAQGRELHTLFLLTDHVTHLLGRFRADRGTGT